MKHGVLHRLAFAVALPFFAGGCGGESERSGKEETEELTKAAPRVIAAMPRSHAAPGPGKLLAVDLQHGGGAKRVVVQREWAGAETLNSHFGSGWADANFVRLAQVSAETVIIWRGGMGWRVMHGRESKFKSAQGETLTKSTAGWTCHLSETDTLTFDAAGRLIAFNAGGTHFDYKYDDKGKLSEIAESAQNFMRYTYDEQGRVKAISGPEKLETRYRYDSGGHLVEVRSDAAVTTTYQYDGDGRLVAAQDQFGHRLEVAAGSLPSPTPEPTASRPALEQAQSKYDAYGRLAEISAPGAGSTRFEYNALGLPTLVATNGATERFSYNRHGMIVRHEVNGAEREQLSYDTNGRLVRRLRSPGGEETFVYDEQDRLIRKKAPSGAEITYGYDASGNLVTESWSSGAVVTRKFDSQNRLIEMIDAHGLKTEFRYDSSGTLTATSDPLHGDTIFRESEDRLEIERRQFAKIGFTVSKSGKPLVIMDSANRRTTCTYDEKGRLISVFPPNRVGARYEYDPQSNLAAIVPSGGPQILVQRDERGRISEIRRGEILWRRYKYDEGGDIAEEHTALGMAAAFTRVHGQITEITTPQGKIKVSATSDGKVVSKGPDFSLEEEFYPDGWLRRRSYQPAGLELSFPRDQSGRGAGIELNGLKAAYRYNEQGQLERIDLPGGRSIQIEHDRAGRITRLKSGEALEAQLGYDAGDRVVSIVARTTKEPALFSESYKFDGAGNISEIAKAGGAERFEYDNADRLTKRISAPDETIFRYDAAGNLSSAGKLRWFLDAMGRPIRQGPKTFGWDTAGNLTSVEDGRTRGANTFDAAGRLVERTNAAGKWRFGYLPDGDRLWRENSKGKAWFAYTDDALAGFKDESGTTWLVVNLPGTDWPLAVCGSNGKTYFIVSDHLRSTRRMVDETGQLTASADFEPFGTLKTPPSASPFLSFAGMLSDESGLLYARQRYYDPSLGRFISIDPEIGTPGDVSSHNAYAYAANNPVRLRDPSGTRLYVDFSNWTDAQLRTLHSLRDIYQQEADKYRTIAEHQMEREALRQELVKRGYLKPDPVSYPNPAPKVKAGSGVPGPQAKVETVAIKPSAKGPTIAVNAPIKGDTLAVAAKTSAESSSILKSLVRGLGTALKFANAIGDAALAAQVTHGFTTMTLAAGEANAAAAEAKAIQNALANKIAEVAATDPTKLIPMPMPDGKPFNPNNPAHVEQLIIQVNSNLANNKKPFEGILATSPDPQQQAELDAALAKARQRYNDALTLEGEILFGDLVSLETATREITASLEQIERAADTMANAQADLAGLPAAADELKKRTTAMQARTQTLRAAEAEMKAAMTSCETAATQACSFAQQAPSATEEQIKAWSAQANSLIFQASNQLNAAQEKVTAGAAGADELRAAIAVLEGFKTQLNLLPIVGFGGGMTAREARQALNDAKRAATAVEKRRSDILAKRNRFPGIKDEIQGILRPYSWSPEAVSLSRDAEELGRDVREPGSFDFESKAAALAAKIEALERLEKLAKATDIDGLIATGNAALQEGDSALTSARSLADNPERYRALQQASKCFAEITFAGKPSPTPSPSASPSPSATLSPPASPTASPGAEEEVAVPDLSGFQTVAEMKAALASVGLNAALVSASEKPPSKEKEFKFAGQTPSAGTKMKRGSTVAIAMYPKFEEADTAPGTVPNVVGMRLSDAVATLRAAGLQFVGIDTGAKPPTEDKANLIYEQSPAAGTPIGENKTFSLKQYGSGKTSEGPEPSEPPSQTPVDPSAADPLIGTWSGTATWPGGKSDPLTIQIQKSGNGYAVTSPDGRTVAASFANGVLSWTDKGSVTIGKEKTTFDVKTTLRLQGDTLVGELSAGKAPVKISLRRK